MLSNEDIIPCHCGFSPRSEHFCRAYKRHSSQFMTELWTKEEMWRMLRRPLAINQRRDWMLEPKYFYLWRPMGIIWGSVTFLRRLMETESHRVFGCLLWTNSRPLRCLETSEGPLLFVFMAVWGFLQQLSTRWKICLLCGIPSLINAVSWDISTGIWGLLWKLISVTVLIPPGRSLTCSVRQTCLTCR